MSQYKNQIASHLVRGLFDPEQMIVWARQSGFCTRIKKIHPYAFWETLCIESVRGTVSYNDLAAHLQHQGGPSASRQAVALKTTEAADRFFTQVLGTVIAGKIMAPSAMESFGFSGKFRRIIVRDSTLIQLPRRLHDTYAGAQNGHGKISGHARIQSAYDLLAGKFILYSIDAYTRNDQTASLDFTPEPGDLLLEDRGYFKKEVMECVREHQAHCIFRYMPPMGFYNPHTADKIPLLSLLEQTGSLDMEVSIKTNKGQFLPVRLIALPVNEETANVRRMRARRQAKGHRLSSQTLHLMNWTIFITTLSSEDISPDQVATLYGIRWRIENIFKTWKSNFCFDHIHNVSKAQFRMLIVARLTMIVLLFQQIFLPLASAISARKHELSLMKFMRYAQLHLNVIIGFCSIDRMCSTLLIPMLRYASYENRKRKSLNEKLRRVLQEIKLEPLT